MKGLSKPISSPGRTEKFPPPLMRFLRSNAGSKSSRGRTRASPMFLRKNKNNVAIEKTQEPSSPKVTCIGQVRVRRSSNNTKKRQRTGQKNNQNNQKTPCCCNFQWKIVKLHRPKSLISNLKKWVCCFPFGYCGKKVESTQKVLTTENIETTNAEIETSESEKEDGYAYSNFNPPKNALILTRCRSAPYRSSSLASKLWGSPLNNHHLSSDNHSTKSQSPRQLEEEEEEEEKTPSVLEKPILPVGVIGDLGSRKSHGNEEMQSSINEESSKACVHPLLLTRCKSEPAGTGERLNLRRFSDTNPLS